MMMGSDLDVELFSVLNLIVTTGRGDLNSGCHGHTKRCQP